MKTARSVLTALAGIALVGAGLRVAAPKARAAIVPMHESTNAQISTAEADAPDAADLVPVPFAGASKGVIDARVVGGAPLLVTTAPQLVRLAPDLTVATTTPVELGNGATARHYLSIFASDAARLFGVVDQGDLIALDSATGAVLWKRSFSSPLDGPLNVLGMATAQAAGSLIVHQGTFGEMRLVGLDANDGATRWEKPGIEKLATNGTDVFSVGFDEKLQKIDPRDGSVKWTTVLPHVRAHHSSDGFAAGRDRVVVLGATTIDLYDATTGELVTETTMGEGIGLDGRRATFAKDGTELYIHGKDALTRIDPETGAGLWSAAGSFGAPVRGRDFLYVPKLGDGSLRALDVATGEERWSYNLGRASTLHLLTIASASFALDGEPEEIVAALGGRFEVDAAITLFRHGHASDQGAAAVDVAVTEGNGGAAKVAAPFIHLFVGDREVVADRDGHWRGVVTGRGVVLIRPVLAAERCGPPARVELGEGDATPAASAVQALSLPLFIPPRGCHCGFPCDF